MRIPPRLRLGSALALAALVMLLAACSSGEKAKESAAKAPPTKAGFDACAFLTKEEVAAAIGQPVGNAVRKQDIQDFSQCFYVFGQQAGGPAVVVEFDKSKASLNVMSAQKSTAEAVSGLGEEAYWAANASALSVKAKGGVLRVSMAIAAAGLKGADLKALAVKLASVAVGRLP